MRKVFCIFQGGGAQGISHIGAYRAVVDEGLEIVGVAGASAGAMIAALIAVGCQPQDILNPGKEANDPTRDILSANHLTPVSVLGKLPWRRFQRLRIAFGGLIRLAFLTLLLAVGVASVPVVMLLGVWFGWSVPQWAAMLGIAALLAVYFWLGWRALYMFKLVRSLILHKGLFEPADVARRVEEILVRCAQAQIEALSPADKARLGDDFELVEGAGAAPGSKLKFSDIDPLRFKGLSCPPSFVALKIATTDLTRGKLRLFGADYHPEASVSEVVAASIAIPFLFKPARIASVERYREHVFVDGGLLANLPVWSFKEEKRYQERRLNPHEPVTNLAFELRDLEPLEAQPGSEPQPEVQQRAAHGWHQFLFKVRAVATALSSLSVTEIKQRMMRYAVAWVRRRLFGQREIGFMGHLEKTIRTGIFGGQAVTHMHVPDLLMIPIHSPVGLLDFDLNWSMACQAELAGQEHALKSLLTHKRAKNSIAAILQSMHDETCQVLRDAGLWSPDLRLRILVFVPAGVTSFKVVHSHNLGDDTDDILQVDVEARGVPDAFKCRRSVAFEWQGACHDRAGAGWWAGTRWVPFVRESAVTRKKETLETRETIPMSKYDVVNIWDGLQSAVCFPLTEAVNSDGHALQEPDVEPLAVVCIDFNRRIAHHLIDDVQACDRIISKAEDLITLLPSSLEDR